LDSPFCGENSEKELKGDFMEITWYCVQCGKQGQAEIDTGKYILPIVSIIKTAGWIVQFNGENTDVYCCKKCAE
jgi:hypothetical protein